MGFLSFFKSGNYFDKNMTPKCDYCQNGKRARDGNKVICEKRGLVDASYSCGKFIYSPLKRIPVKQLNFVGSLADEDLYSESARERAEKEKKLREEEEAEKAERRRKEAAERREAREKAEREAAEKEAAAREEAEKEAAENAIAKEENSEEPEAAEAENNENPQEAPKAEQQAPQNAHAPQPGAAPAMETLPSNEQ